MEAEKTKDSWSEDGFVNFIGGWGWGLTEKLRTICLGKEGDINSFFETGEVTWELSPIHRRVLYEILEYRREYGIGKTGLVRTVTNGTTGSKQKTTGRSTPRKRLALRSSKQKGKNLFRR